MVHTRTKTAGQTDSPSSRHLAPIASGAVSCPVRRFGLTYNASPVAGHSHESSGRSALLSKPSWYAISRQDRTISPELQRFLAKRMNATTVEIDSGHLSLITHPQEVTQLILSAARAASQYGASRQPSP
jgi:pimeloyl-ACP methyl ester carboxylesterase